MKYFKILFLFLLFTQPAWANYSIIAHTVGQSTNNNTVTTPNIDTTGADLIVVTVVDFALGSACTFSDSNTNTWTVLNSYLSSSNARIRFVYVRGGTVGAGHNFSCSKTNGFPTLQVVALSGSAATPFDVQNGNATQNVTTIQPGSVTPTNNNSILITGISSSESVTETINSSFTIQDQVEVNANAWGVTVATKIQTNKAAENPTWSGGSSSNDDVTNIAVFASSVVAASGPNTGSLTLTGVGK